MEKYFEKFPLPLEAATKQYVEAQSGWKYLASLIKGNNQSNPVQLTNTIELPIKGIKVKINNLKVQYSGFASESPYVNLIFNSTSNIGSIYITILSSNNHPSVPLFEVSNFEQEFIFNSLYAYYYDSSTISVYSYTVSAASFTNSPNFLILKLYDNGNKLNAASVYLQLSTSSIKDFSCEVYYK